jgi:glycosyltransferase involved in cell wall biosynthesis
MNGVLNIAVDARHLAYPNSGIGRYVGNLLREFAAQPTPHRFFLYCDRPFELRFPLPEHWKIRTGKLKSGGLSTAFAQVFFPFWALKDRINIFWSPRHQLPLLLPPRSRKVLTVHDVTWKRFPQTMNRSNVILEALLMPVSLRLADQAITDSQFARSEILTYFPSAKTKLEVVYLASSLKTDGETGSCPLTAPYFLFVGNYEPRKNLERMLKGYIQYRMSSARPLDLVILGAAQWGAFDVHAFVKTNRLETSVHLIQKAEDTVLRALYANARALVMVSLYEGFGLPLVEAMQWSTPLIASNTSSVAEIAGDAALLVDPLDIDAIASAFTRMTEDDNVRSELAAKAGTRGRLFSWKLAAAETMALLAGQAVLEKY